MMRPRTTWAMLAAGALGLVLGCGPRRYVRATEPPPGRARVAPDSAATGSDAALEPGMLAAVATAPVSGWAGPGNRPFEVALRSAAPEAGHTRMFGTVALPIALRNRAAAISQYPCTSCHAGRSVVLAGRRIGDAHQNIRPVHPRQAGTACSACHAPENVALVALRSGERATMDESYQLCAECHFREVEAWAAGAHGKRLDGWQGRRVVMACADCHDPHGPAVPVLVPFRAPHLERPRRANP